MINLSQLLSTSSSFQNLIKEGKRNNLSHAYLFLSSDDLTLKGALKTFSKIIACEGGEGCGKCRNCTLIEADSHADVITYPIGKDSVKTEDVTDLIEKSFVKPIEGNKKIFIINNAETMLAPAQNKLLKTLEEPPKNVYIILGAKNEHSILSTILSRVKKVVIPPFTDQVLFDYLIEDCPIEEKLKTAIACGDGTIGKALTYYQDEKFNETVKAVVDTIVDMQSSKQLLKYSTKLLALKVEQKELLSIFESVLKDLLAVVSLNPSAVKNKAYLDRLKEAKGYNLGATIYALDKVSEAQKRLKFNANPTMLCEWLLFQILEGKFKWQKL